MDNLIKDLSYFYDENGNVKEIDFTNPEDVKRCQTLFEQIGKLCSESPLVGVMLQMAFGVSIDELKNNLEELISRAQQPVEKDEFEKLVDKYMEEEILPLISLTPSQEKNMRQAYYDYTKWLYNKC